MKNPWNSKNPWLSLCLSGANSALGHARGQAAAAQGRQAALAQRAAQDIAAYWLGAMLPAAPTRASRRRKR